MRLAALQVPAGAIPVTETTAAFPRREFLISVASFGALGALARMTLPTLPALVRDARTPLPTWVTATPRTARAYRIALRRGDLLAQLNCYCGCMDSANLHHTSLRDCYLGPDGGLNQHAAGCDVCQAEALDAERWANAGLAPATIRDRIDDTYAVAGCSLDRCID